MAPKVQVYSYGPGVFDKPNTFICHASGFYPPEITIELLRNGELIPEANQTDLAFEEDWHYHLTRHVTFTPVKGDDYACRVTHGGTSKMYTWGMCLSPSDYCLGFIGMTIIKYSITKFGCTRFTL